MRFRLVDLDMTRGLPLDLVFSRGARSVRDLMSKDVVTIDREESIEAAMDCMQSLEIRHLPVTNTKSRVVGMLTDRDVLRSLPLPVPQLRPKEKITRFRQRLFSTLADQRPVGAVNTLMESDPSWVRPEALLVEAIQLMQDKGLTGLPVIDAEGVLCGIVTTTDILRVFRVVMQIGTMLNAGDAA